MTTWNERCDCCGRRLQRIPSEFYPGEELIGGLGYRKGRYCEACYYPIVNHPIAFYLPKDGEITPCPTHVPPWWAQRRTA